MEAAEHAVAVEVQVDVLLMLRWHVKLLCCVR